MTTWHVPAPAEESFEPVPPAPGMEIARTISKQSETDLGGGIIRYTDDAVLEGWKLGFDELLHVLEGRIVVEPESGDAIDAGPGETVILAQGSVVDCKGERGTRLFFTLYPRHLTEGPANASKYGRPDLQESP